MASQFGKRILIGTVTLGMALSLAACGNSATPSGSSAKSSSTQTMDSTATAVKQANHLISEGKYQAALDKLNALDHQTTTTSALRRDLKNYLAAKSSLKDNNYDEAATSLSTVKSTSSSMKSAYSKLRSQIASAKESGTSTNATSQANSNSNSSAANASVASATSEDVVNTFASQAGFNKEGYGIIPVSKNGNVYRFEVRQDNADGSVANFVGIYDFNATTKQITQIQ
ncbi:MULTISPECIES: hypothetical protein [Lactobacillaceae]|uniref:Lipoprotein n=1 Tax=Limosilactobacillus alvi TaxID=990412 RepID=A0ABS2EP06_9LACO|nr:MULTISPECIES: hypothetical protein [Lactobacillaceae]MBM6753832.1 hypothetical protein [Limosilactobacillus alvi]QLL69329.1 hypothetical protein GTO83_01505 [Lactobacillus sp. 3B(2020)]